MHVINITQSKMISLFILTPNNFIVMKCDLDRFVTDLDEINKYHTLVSIYYNFKRKRHYEKYADETTAEQMITLDSTDIIVTASAHRLIHQISQYILSP
jgi:hypothetical protein